MRTTTLENQTAHDREGGIWAYVSPSRLNLWLRCPLAFRLRYIDGIRTPTSPSLFVGKQVHASLERHYRHKQCGITLDPEDVVRSVNESWDEAVAAEQIEFESAAAQDKLKQQASGLVRSYIGQVPEEEPRPIAVEVTMEAELVDPGTLHQLQTKLLAGAESRHDPPRPRSSSTVRGYMRSVRAVLNWARKQG